MLPTYEDIMKCYEWNRHKLKSDQNTKKEPTYKEIEAIVVPKITEIWTSASIPTVQQKVIKVMLKAYHLKCKNILKSHPKIPKKNLEEFRNASKVLFDISTCKCFEITLCTCPKQKKVPAREHNFLIDQRSTRKMIIGGVDTIATAKMNKGLQRKACQSSLLSEPCDGPQNRLLFSPSGSESTTSSEHNDNFDSPTKKVKTEPLKKKKVNYDLLAKTCDRFGVSDRVAAAIVSAVLQPTTAEVVDKNKIRRQRELSRKCAIQRAKVSSVPALYFDGRKDKTLVLSKKNGKIYKSTVLEEHISLIKEPGTEFLGYISPVSGTSKCVEKSIVDYFLEQNISTDDLVAVGCDGTNVNVGRQGGIIRLLEKRFNRPLQWIVCLLHMNELPFRHLFQHMDGKTSGPQTFAGPIGKLLENCEERSVVQYQPIPGELPDVTVEELSVDQKYLYQIVLAVITGEFPTDLGNKSPGKMSHARWLTRANRVMRLYVSTISPSEKLVVLATFVVKAYAPTWFSIKTHPTCKDGARHLHKLIAATRYLPDQLKAVVDPVIQRNGYFAHPENLLLSMLTDTQQHIRELAARCILKARSIEENVLRLFEIPSINFDARTSN